MDVTNKKPLIDLRSITKVFYTDEIETRALSDVFLRIFPGEFVSIAGPSGSGKSTLLSVMGLLDSPTTGQFLLDEEDVSGLSFSQRAQVRNQRIGFVFQSFNLIGDLTVHENVELPLTFRRMPPAERKKQVKAVLERVGMSHRLNHFPLQLSGGQQQRVAVARALVGNPAILLADEPTGNLDSMNGESIMELLAELHHEGATICIVTHDPRYVQFSERIVQLFDGCIIQDEATGSLKASGYSTKS